jgi:hypothetical protein
MISMALAVEFTRIMFESFKRFARDALRYDELTYDERDSLWKRVQVAFFIALMPVFLALGALFKRGGLGGGSGYIFSSRSSRKE